MEGNTDLEKSMDLHLWVEKCQVHCKKITWDGINVSMLTSLGNAICHTIEEKRVNSLKAQIIKNGKANKALDNLCF